MGKVMYFIYPVLSAVLLSLPWLLVGPGYLLFVGFVPLLLLERRFSENKNNTFRFQFWNYLLIAFFLWNLLSAWWLGYATLTGFFLFLLLNTFLMSGIWYLYHLFKLRTSENLALLFLVALWLAFEFLHLNWDMQLPGMTLGGAFGNQVMLVQWYEYTGELGGSLWVLLVNIYLYKLIWKSKERRRLDIRLMLICAIVILLPICISFYQYFQYQENGDEIHLRVLQPNINPYTEKFGVLSAEEQVEILASLIDSSSVPRLVVGPETALSPCWEDSMQRSDEWTVLKQALNVSPKTSILVGANTKKYLKDDEPITPTTRFCGTQKKYEEYNSAILISPEREPQVYHKNILVSGVEKVPFVKYMSFLDNAFFDLGGTAGGLKSGSPKNFVLGDSLMFCPVICFESMFGEYLGELVRLGGTFMVVITNDGWWKESAGASLHFSYSRLRAIETRRSIARSANTGFSGFINQRGEVLSQTDWWRQTALDGTIRTNQQLTFFVKYGDYIGRIAAFVAVMLLLFLISTSLKERASLK